LLLAGDSAHQMPPFLGQGMCSGLRDAGNLAWKLHDVISRDAPDELLNTYETERMEHVRAYIELAVKLGSVIQTTDPEKARQRDSDLVANPTMLRPLAPRLGHGLDRGAPPPVGTRARQPRLADGTMLDDRVGCRFAVLATAAFINALPAATRAKLKNSDVAMVAAEGESAEYLAELRTSAVVIRPDRYILGVAANAAEFDRVMARRPWRTDSTPITKRTPQNAATI
jgi:3-(3-hydroxy-phenyl)propionate hydroxylase